MRRVILTALVIPLILSCSGSDTIEPVNQAPSIRFTFDPIAVDYNSQPILTVSVSDPDDDPLTVTWSITPGAGTLTSTNPENTSVRWVPTRAVGTDTVTVTVSDGDLTDTVTDVVLKRATKEKTTLRTTDFRKEDSPYLLESRDNPSLDPTTILIPAGYTVTIEAGVEIYIAAAGQDIDVLGTLQANGEPQDTISIWPNSRTLRCGEGRGWWKWIQATTYDQDVGRVNLNYTTISHAEVNVWVRQGDASANLQNSRLICSRDAGVKMSSNGTLVVNGCDISSNRQFGVEISSLSALPASVVITNTNISSNSHTGIYMDLQDVNQVAPISITGNNISFNSINGIFMTNTVWATIQNNDLVFNNLSTLSNIRLDHTDTPFPFGATDPTAWDTLLAINNYWGAEIDPSDIGLIESSVWDSADYPGVVGTRIIVEPWQNTSQYNP
jgi:hypothetical protein